MTATLLIVDDEPRIFQALRRALHKEDLEVLHAASGDEALELIDRVGAIDVVLADQNMPGMSGSQFLSLLRQRWPNTVRMMLTGEAQLDVVSKAVNQGQIANFFTKPCDEAELIVAIREALHVRDKPAGTPGPKALDEHRQTRTMVLDRTRRSDDKKDTPVIDLDSNDLTGDVDTMLHHLKDELDDLSK